MSMHPLMLHSPRIGLRARADEDDEDDIGEERVRRSASPAPSEREPRPLGFSQKGGTGVDGGLDLGLAGLGSSVGGWSGSEGLGLGGRPFASSLPTAEMGCAAAAGSGSEASAGTTPASKASSCSTRQAIAGSGVICRRQTGARQVGHVVLPPAAERRYWSIQTAQNL